ncbi:phage portal protein, HK97 family [Mycobacterium sp. 88mf]|nr:phage portal protein, HK97 family [Mycobacterium sp. 88mf]SFG61584.1 phage portal protein, HK97 family [Mycobacterium sp. 455mf]
MAWWPWSRNIAPQFDDVETRSVSVSIGDPAAVELFGLGAGNLAGMPVGEHSVLGISAVYRAVSLISGSIASLPMRTIITDKDGYTERANSFLDTPGGTGSDAMTAFEFKETVLCHLLLHGNAYLFHLYGGAGQIIGLLPIHPLAVAVDMTKDFTKVFTVTLNDGTAREFGSRELTHIPALSTDGIRGLSPIAVARNMFGTTMAGEKAAARMFANGNMTSGLVTPEDTDGLTAEEAKTIKNDIRNRIQGTDNAGEIVVINRRLRFSQWSLSAEDAQFLQSRAFQIEEVARWFGLMPFHLAQTEKQTSWGTGIEEQNRGLARYTLEPWTTRVQERLTRLLTGSKKVEFDYTAFVQPSPETEIGLLIDQVEAGLLTKDEARRIRNMPPLTQAQKDEIAADKGLLPEEPLPDEIPPEPTDDIEPAHRSALAGTNGKVVAGHG